MFAKQWAIACVLMDLYAMGVKVKGAVRFLLGRNCVYQLFVGMHCGNN